VARATVNRLRHRNDLERLYKPALATYFVPSGGGLHGVCRTRYAARSIQTLALRDMHS